LHNNNILP